MAKIFKGDVNFGFVINQTGAQPLDSRSVVQSYAELLNAETFGTAIYNGMTVATIDEQKVYMLVDKTKATIADGWKEIGAGGAVSVDTYAEAIALASDENIGQVIYVKTKSSYDADGEGDGAAVEYDAAPYIVIGTGSLQKLAASTASGDIEGDVANLTTKVLSLETVVGNDENGIVKDVNDLKNAVDALPETFVTDVKNADGNSIVVDGVVTLTDYATKSYVDDGLAAKADSSVVYTKTEVDAVLANKLEAADIAELATKNELSIGLADKADSSVVYTKEQADSTFVKSEGYVAFSQAEKDKLADIDEGAEVNYIKAVGDNLFVDSDGKLIVSIPEVNVPFQSVAENDKVLALDNGVLSTTLAYAREDVEGVDSLVLKGIDGVVIGSVPVADFIADGMLESVTPEEGTNNFIFTFKTGNGTTESFKVDFSKYVDTYNADGTTLELKVVDGKNVFNVKAGVFDDAGAAATAEQNAKSYADGKFQEKGAYETAGAAAAVEIKLNEYKDANDAIVAEKVDTTVYTAKVNEIDSSISTINISLDTKAVKADVSAALDLKANIADVYTSLKVDELLGNKVDTSVYTAKVNEIDSSISAIITDLTNKADASVVEDALAGKVDIVEGSSLVSDTLIAKLDNMVEIKSVGGDLTLTDGALSVDLSSYATIADTSANFVQKDGDKVLSTNDFTNEFKTKLENIAAGAEVNYVKSVGANLAVSDAGELTVDLSAYAKSEDVSTALTNGLATKLDASATVNGISFIDGAVVLDADDIKASVAFGTLKSGETTTDRYTTNDSIQTILASLDSRIDAINTVFDETFEGVIVSVQGSNAIGVTTGTSPEISLKVSSEIDNAVSVKADGVYVADMRSYWEGI